MRKLPENSTARRPTSHTTCFEEQASIPRAVDAFDGSTRRSLSTSLLGARSAHLVFFFTKNNFPHKLFKLFSFFKHLFKHKLSSVNAKVFLLH